MTLLLRLKKRKKMKIPKDFGVYKITSPSQRVYVGSSVNLRSRYNTYKNYPSKKQKLLFRSINKYGFEQHSFEILCLCEPSERLKKERFYGDAYKSLSTFGGLNLILPMSDDSPAIYSEQTIKLFSEIGKNRKYSAETRLKFSQAKKGKYQNGEHPAAKLIINTSTGIYYECIKEAAQSVNIKRSTLSMMLIGINKNRTSFNYA